jgi:hypothetical protein
MVARPRIRKRSNASIEDEDDGEGRVRFKVQRRYGRRRLWDQGRQ